MPQHDDLEALLGQMSQDERNDYDAAVAVSIVRFGEGGFDQLKLAQDILGPASGSLSRGRAGAIPKQKAFFAALRQSMAHWDTDIVDSVVASFESFFNSLDSVEAENRAEHLRSSEGIQRRADMLRVFVDKAKQKKSDKAKKEFDTAWQANVLDTLKVFKAQSISPDEQATLGKFIDNLVDAADRETVYGEYQKWLAEGGVDPSAAAPLQFLNQRWQKVYTAVRPNVSVYPLTTPVEDVRVAVEDALRLSLFEEEQRELRRKSLKRSFDSLVAQLNTAMARPDVDPDSTQQLGAVLENINKGWEGLLADYNQVIDTVGAQDFLNIGFPRLVQTATLGSGLQISPMPDAAGSVGNLLAAVAGGQQQRQEVKAKADEEKKKATIAAASAEKSQKRFQAIIAAYKANPDFDVNKALQQHIDDQTMTISAEDIIKQGRTEQAGIIGAEGGKRFEAFRLAPAVVAQGEGEPSQNMAVADILNQLRPGAAAALAPTFAPPGPESSVIQPIGLAGIEQRLFTPEQLAAPTPNIERFRDLLSQQTKTAFGFGPGFVPPERIRALRFLDPAQYAEVIRATSESFATAQAMDERERIRNQQEAAASLAQMQGQAQAAAQQRREEEAKARTPKTRIRRVR